jgi:hypothetical protein
MKSANAEKRLDILSKLATIEKRIKALGDKLVDKKVLKLFQNKEASDLDSAENLNKFLSYANEKEILGGLNQCKCVLSPREFIKVFAPSEFNHIDFDKLFSCDMPFSKLLNDKDIDIFCNDDTYEGDKCYDLNILGAIDKLIPSCGVSEDALMDRACSCNDRPAKITITVENYDNMSDILKEYLNYFISACSGLNDREMTAAMLQM